MKTSIQLRVFGVLAIMALLVIQNSCRENEPASAVPIEFQPIEKQREFVREQSKPIAKAVLSLANDTEFREILYKEIEKKPGENTVLIGNLIQIKTSSGQTIKQKMEAKVGLGTIDKVLGSFKNIGGETFYPQIFIPHYDNIQSKRTAKESGRTEYYIDDVVAVFYDGNETLDVVDGYTLSESGEFSESILEVDEEYTTTNEVWVLSLNESGETVQQTYDPNTYYDPYDPYPDPTTPGGAIARVAASGSAIINTMKCKCHKESWLGGASEVNIITSFSGNTTSAYLSVEHYGGGSYEGGRIHKFTRSSVRDRATRTVDYGLNSYWDGGSRTSATFAHSVIFEYDIWPTGKRTAEWTNFAGGFLNVEYRSSDGFYERNSIEKSVFFSYTMNNSCMEWNGR